MMNGILEDCEKKKQTSHLSILGKWKVEKAGKNVCISQTNTHFQKKHWNI